MLVNAFGPSKEVEPFVRTFLLKHVSDKADGVGVMSKCEALDESLAPYSPTSGMEKHADPNQTASTSCNSWRRRAVEAGPSPWERSSMPRCVYLVLTPSSSLNPKPISIYRV